MTSLLDTYVRCPERNIVGQTLLNVHDSRSAQLIVYVTQTSVTQFIVRTRVYLYMKTINFVMFL